MIPGALPVEAVEIAARATVLLALATILAHLLRRSSAEARRRLWSVAIVGVLALPIISVALPDLPVRILPAAAEPQPAQQAQPLARWTEATGPIEWNLSPTITPVEEAAIAQSIQRSTEQGSAIAAIPAPAHSNTPALPIDLPTLLLSVWALGALVVLGSLAASLLAIRRLSRSAQVVEDGEWLQCLAWARRRAGLRTPVRILVSDRIDSPMTWGGRPLGRTVVAMPADSSRWSTDRRRLALLHECIHAQRADWLLQIASTIACAIHWFNPLAWLAASRLRAERERACDERAIDVGAPRAAYAQLLLDVARSFASAMNPAPRATLAMARTSELEGRLLMILSPNAAARRGAAIIAPIALISVAGLIAVASPERAEQAQREREDRARIEERAQEEYRAQTIEQRQPEADHRRTIDAQRQAEHEARARALTLRAADRAGRHGEHADMHIGSTPGSHSHFSSNDDEISYSIRVMDGASIEFDDHTTTLNLGDHGVIVLSARHEGRETSLRMVGNPDDSVDRLFLVDGEERPFDHDAKEWMVAMLDLARGHRDIGRVHGQVGAYHGQIGAIHGEVGAMQGRIGQLHGEAGRLQGQIGRINGELGRMQGEIGQLQGKHAGLRGELSGLKAQANSARRRIEAADRVIERLEERADDLERTGRTQNADHVRAELKALLVEREAVEIELRAMERANEDRIAAIDKELREIEHKLKLRRAALDEARQKTEREREALQEQIASLRTGERAEAVQRELEEVNAEARIAAIQEKIEALNAEERVETIKKDILDPARDRLLEAMEEL